MQLRKPALPIALAMCALAYIASLGTERIAAAYPDIEAEIEGVFPREGHYHDEPLAHAAGVRTWGSLGGSYEDAGSIALGPFPAPARLRFGVTGHPARSTNEIGVELVAGGERVPLRTQSDMGSRWNLLDVDIPAAWVGQPVRLYARDTGGVWIGITEPIRGGLGEGLNGLRQTLASWIVNGCLLGLLWFAALDWLTRIVPGWSRGAPAADSAPNAARTPQLLQDETAIAPHWRPLLAGAVVAALGYIAFWIYFANAFAGKCFSVAVVAAALLHAWRRPRGTPGNPEFAHVARLLVSVGAFYVALLHLYPFSGEFDGLAANRFREAMPGDNTLSYNLAEALYSGRSAKSAGADYQTSDRPPLQSGWLLLTWPVTRVLGFNERGASGTAAMWFQLLWIPAAYGLLRALRLPPGRAAAWTGVMALSGFFLQNTVFTWPKLAAGAFAVGAFGLWIRGTQASRPRPAECGPEARASICAGAALAALGWLAHGAVAFSLLALAPWLLWRAVARGEARTWLLAAGVFLVFALPWLGYQQLYDPPANMLLKEHLAGVHERDSRGTWAAIRDSYRASSWAEIVARKQANFATQFSGSWSSLLDFSARGAAARRSEEFAFTGRALTWWLIALPLLGLVLGRGASRRKLAALWPSYRPAAGWTALTILIWCLLIYHGHHAVIHHGSYAVMLVLFVLFSAWLELAGRWTLAAVALLQAATLASTYAVSNEWIHGPPVGLPFLVLTGGAVAVVIISAVRSGNADRRIAAPATRLVRAAWLAAGFALLLVLARDGVLSWMTAARPLAAIEPTEDASWIAGGFRHPGVYPTTADERLPGGVATAGSWLDTDEWQGRAETVWFEVRSRGIRVAVAGYPRNPGCGLWAEFRHFDGAITRVDCPAPNPGEQWDTWELRRPEQALAVRIVAEDYSTAHSGWLAFSKPYTTRPLGLVNVYLHAQAFTMAALVLAACLIFARARTSRAAAPGTRDQPELTVNDSKRRRAIRGAILVFGAMAVVVCPIHIGRESAQPLSGADEPLPMAIGQFAPGGTHGGINLNEVPQGLATRGSWFESGDFRGTHVTGWFQAQPNITMFVSGYPNLNGNRLELEVRGRDGALRPIPFTDDYPGEKWQPWLIRLPSDAEAVRVRAVDDSTGPVGWLAFSEPFVAKPKLGRQAWSLFQLFTTACLALTLLYGPGLLWWHDRGRSPHQLAFAILHGPLLLAAIGLACWVAAGYLPPATAARAGVTVLMLWILWRGWPARCAWRLPQDATAVIAAGALLVGFGAAKANLSHGPAGELFHHSISRSLAVGGHSDSRISYHTAQLIGNGLSPFGPEAEELFYPWSFGSRGPLAGLMAAPIVLATGATPPRGLPDQAWQPFDQAGFAVYRIALMALASLAVWAVFGAVAAVASPGWAAVAAIAVLLTPFFAHELYFTWPKLMAAALVLVSFLLANKGRAFASGGGLALGYLFHPLAILSAPFVALWLLLRHQEGARWTRLRGPAVCAAGALLLVVPWQIIGQLYRGDNATQTIFLVYFQIADGRMDPTWAQWWQSRWDNFANTFIPGYMFTADPKHDSINSAYGASDGYVRGSFAYWSTLPLALGVPGFLLAAAAVGSACRRAPAIACATVLGPALLLIAYWGAASTGLMRHCGHTLFLSVVVLAVWSLARWRSSWRATATAALLHPICFAWRAAEIVLVAFGTTLLNRMPRLQSVYGWNDLLSVAIAAGCLAGAVILLANIGQSLRSRLFQATPATL